MIFPLYQPLGVSTHLLAKKAGGLLAEKTTHTGTLDPMAEGVVVVLSGDDRFNKDKYSAWKKEYYFEILFGAATDSYDLLGLTTKDNIWYPTQTGKDLVEKIRPKLANFLGRQSQMIPSFSAKRIYGQSYFDLAKANNKPPSKSQEIEIFELEVLAYQDISAVKLKKGIEEKIGLVKGNFRQAESVTSWEEYFQKLPSSTATLPVLAFRATTSKRTYIRALVRDLSAVLNIPATTHSITRTANGPFEIKDCLCLI